MTSSGIRYSNIEPLQDSSIGSPPAVDEQAAQREPVLLRQLALGDRTKLHSRASEASRS